MSAAHVPAARTDVASASPRRQPTCFISHGGGPWPCMTGPFRDAQDQLEESLQRLPSELPEAPMREDAERGFHHGTYSVLFPAWPDADVPVVQLAIDSRFDPAEHLAVGRALAPLRDEGFLILGSGSSYHDLCLMGPGAEVPSAQFDDWLVDTLNDRSAEERAARLVEWSQAPSARVAHPREDHLLPLLVVAGAAGDDEAVRSYREDAWNGTVVTSSSRFGEPVSAGTVDAVHTTAAV